MAQSDTLVRETVPITVEDRSNDDIEQPEYDSSTGQLSGVEAEADRRFGLQQTDDTDCTDAETELDKPRAIRSPEEATDESTDEEQRSSTRKGKKQTENTECNAGTDDTETGASEPNCPRNSISHSTTRRLLIQKDWMAPNMNARIQCKETNKNRQALQGAIQKPKSETMETRNSQAALHLYWSR